MGEETSYREADIVEPRDRQSREGSETPVETFAALFEAQASHDPSAVAVRFEEGTLTYGELEHRANQLARLLRERGVGPEELVAVLLPRSPEMVVAILAVLKAGGAFLPLDPRVPVERVRSVLEDAMVILAVTDTEYEKRLPGSPRVLITEAKDRNGDRLDAVARGENAAYVIYTSGSTGKPKGVTIENRNLVAYTLAVLARLGIHEPMSFCHISTFAADLGHTALFPALASGGSVDVISHDRQADPVALAEHLQRHPADVLKIVPSHLSALLSAGRAVLPRKRLVFGGEALSWELVDRVRSYFPACEVFNHYGPTETTVGVIAGRVPDKGESRSVPMGFPLADATVALLDLEKRPVGDGEPGELVISGAAVGRGYWRRESFGGVYRTGDLARRLQNGSLEFIGRMDDQVKIRGYRVEPGEVRAAIFGLGVENIVVAREDEPGEKRLVAYLVRPPMASSELEKRLRLELPAFMVPSAFVPIDALPLTSNGKVDRQALPAPETQASEQVDEPDGQFELELASIWRRHLGRRIGAHTDFFEAGGHSLIAAKIAAEASRRFSCDVPPTLLLEKPTIASLARELQRRPKRRWSPLVPIQPQGERPPLFCVHGGMGTVMFYGKLANLLGPQQPVFGLQPRGLYDSSRPNKSVEQLAADYITEIRRVQPHGPYSLTGRCFGAVFALEIAQQLLAAGEEVGHLVALDGGPDLTEREPTSKWASRQVRDLRRKSASEKGKLLLRKGRLKAGVWKDEVALQASYGAGELFRRLGLPIPARLRALYTRTNHRRMIERYVARRYPGPVLLLRWNEYQDPWLGWKQIVEGTVDLEEVSDQATAWTPFCRALAGRQRRETLAEVGISTPHGDSPLADQRDAVESPADTTARVSSPPRPSRRLPKDPSLPESRRPSRDPFR